MKKTVLMGFWCWLLGVGFAHAQRYVVVDDKIPVVVSDVEKITYAVDDQFETTLLAGRLAADPKTQLFSQALQETGLADTLQAYLIDYTCPYTGKYRYPSYSWYEVAWYNTQRFRMFTVFAETDDVLSAQSINSLSDLKAYAKRVYDAVYPEDAGVSDPTDRRNSLNRFVAYHILRHGSTYYYLTAYDNYKLMFCFDSNLADIAAWYATLMPGAAMKCSYPDAGDESGLYLNRRGLKDGPDKYGKQIRGSKIVADGDGSEDPFTHKAFNGYYYYIDRMLTYDQQTRDDVLGGERWRIDAKTLSPDILNVYDRYGFYENLTDAIDPNAPDVKNHIFAWDGIENFSNTIDNPGLVLRRPNLGRTLYDCDDMYLKGGTTSHENGFSHPWDVTQAWHQKGQYAVAVVWQDDMPQNFQARHGVCLSSEPNVSVEHCDSMKYYKEIYPKRIHTWGGMKIDADHLHFMIIGKNIYERFITGENNGKGFELDALYGERNRVDATLQPGNTYYYRTFAEVQVEEGGQVKTNYFYAPEGSFRVLNVMGDAAYFPYPQGTEDAVAAFAAHFPDSVTAPKWKEMEALWDKWRKTPEGEAIDLTPYITTETFEDGTGYRLNYIPDEFYDWMAKHEVVIDAFGGLAEARYALDTTDPNEPPLKIDSVANVDDSWNVAGGKYIRFSPIKSTLNIRAVYRGSEVMPGIRYKLLVNFAPETVTEKTDSTEVFFLSTKVDVADVKAKKTLVTKHEVPVTEASTLVIDDFCTTAPWLDLKIETNVTNLERRRNLFNRIMRIAEMRLIPIRPDE